MFVTGPDVVRSRSPARTSTWSPSAVPTRTAGAAASCTSSPTPSDEALDTARARAALLAAAGHLRPRGRSARTSTCAPCCPSNPNRAYDVQPLIDGVLDEPTLETARAGGRRTSSPASAGSPGARSASSPTTRCAWAAASTRASAEKAARFVRMCDAFGVPLVVLVDVPGLPARRRPGVGRRRAPRREAAARVRRGGRAAGDAGDPQGLRRRLHRDELPLARGDRGVRLARRRGRGHGREGRRRHPAPQEAGRGAARRARGAARRSWPRSTSGSPAASTGRWRSASSTRSSSRSGPRAALAEALAAAPRGRGAHGNIPL